MYKEREQCYGRNTMLNELAMILPKNYLHLVWTEMSEEMYNQPKVNVKTVTFRFSYNLSCSKVSTGVWFSVSCTHCSAILVICLLKQINTVQ